MVSRPSFARRVALAGVAVAGAVSVLASMTTGIEHTEAAWVDTEVGQASVRTSWAEGFVRTTNPGWKMHRVRDSRAAGDWPLVPEEVTRDYVMTYPAPEGSTTTEYTPAATGDFRRTSRAFSDGKGAWPLVAGSVPARDIRNGGDRVSQLGMGRFPASGANAVAGARLCLSFPGAYSLTATTDDCTWASSRIQADHYLEGYTFSIQSSTYKRARINVANFGSSARCDIDGSSYAEIRYDSSSTLEFARQTGTNDGSFDSRSSFADVIPPVDDPEVRHDGTHPRWFRYSTLDNYRNSFVLSAHVRRDVYTTDFYAIAEMDLVVQIYTSGGSDRADGWYVDQINLPITRSECGLSNGEAPVPPRAGTWRGDDNQLGWPERSLSNVATGQTSRGFAFDSSASTGAAPSDGLFSRFGGMAMARSAPEPEADATETTTGSPDVRLEGESTTRESAGTTTSAPPEPGTDGTDAGTVTTTSSPGPVVIPTEPERLATGDPTRIVGNVRVDDAFTDVLVRGSDLPGDRTAGVRALDRWVTDGLEPDRDWEAFTSDDPASDGWRWAVISQITGTVLYIR